MSADAGEIVWYGGSSAPAGWLLCDGSFVSQATYGDLFGILGHAYNGGTDPGDGTFRLPNFQNTYVLGKAAAGTGSTLGGTGGAAAHTHTGPSHSHTVVGPSDHGSHTIGQGNDHGATQLAHSGFALNNHGALSHSGLAVANHTVGQPSAHASHAASEAAGSHTHDNHVDALRPAASTARTTGPTTHRGAWDGTNETHQHTDAHSHSGQNVDAHSVTQADQHAAQSHTVNPQANTHTTLSHSSANLDAHSTHSGAGTDAAGTGATGVGGFAYIKLNGLVRV
jgi:microcystin-dependent protein